LIEQVVFAMLYAGRPRSVPAKKRRPPLKEEMMTDRNPKRPGVSRREFFTRFADGLHGSALAWLLGSDLFSTNPSLALELEGGRGAYDLKPKPAHF